MDNKQKLTAHNAVIESNNNILRSLPTYENLTDLVNYQPPVLERIKAALETAAGLYGGHGKYVWKRYEYVNATITMTMTDYGSTNNAKIKLATNDFDLSLLNFEDLAGIKVNYSHSGGTWVLEFKDNKSVVLDGRSYPMMYNADTAEMYVVANFGAIVTFASAVNATVKIPKDYLVSDDPTAYPDGEDFDGYWYVMETDKSGVAYGMFSLAASTSKLIIPHGMERTPSKAFIIGSNITLTSSSTVAIVLSTENIGNYYTSSYVTDGVTISNNGINRITPPVLTADSKHLTASYAMAIGTYYWFALA